MSLDRSIQLLFVNHVYEVSVCSVAVWSLLFDVTGRIQRTSTMKAAVVAVLVVMVAAASARECDMLARLNVKSQWMRAYSSGHDREHFAEAIWRA